MTNTSDISTGYVRLAHHHQHLLMIAFMGKTAEHLREVHSVTPAEDWRENRESKRANAAAHLEAHREPR